MSRIKVNRIENTSTTDGGIDIDTDGHVKVDGLQLPTAGALSSRRMNINGAMQVAQRETNASISDGANEGYRTLDRWKVLFSSGAGGVATMTQDTTVPNKEFANSLKIDVTTADTSIDVNHAISIQYRFEAQDIANSGWDYNSSSSFLNVSFWARSNKAGTYCVFFQTLNGTTHGIVNEYTLAANTWQYVSFSVPGNSALQFDDSSGGGLNVGWTLVAGSNRQDGVTAGQWIDATTGSAQGRYATSNQVNFFDSTNNNWYLTGVQIEVGSKATSFEHRSYGDELARCQRYYVEISGGNDAFTYSGKGQGSNSVDVTIPLCVPLRASPTLNSIDSRAFTDSGSFAASSSTTPTAIQFSANNPHLAINCGGFSGLTNNEISVWGPRSNVLEISAEL